jgi:hypothetical protein
MSFEKFLTNMQAMFTGFEDNDELLTDAQKIRLLFQKVQSPSLTQVKNALQVSYDLDKAGEVTYDFLANSMAAEAASLPDHAPSTQRLVPPRLVESRAQTEISSLDFIRTSRVSLMMRKRQSSMRGSASTSTPSRVAVIIPKRARRAPSKLTRKSVKDDQRNFFYEGQAQRRQSHENNLRRRGQQCSR